MFVFMVLLEERISRMSVYLLGAFAEDFEERQQ